jgi:peptidoglycan/xylan/chitin deacetylase (PgdA/CDA1 family)
MSLEIKMNGARIQIHVKNRDLADTFILWTADLLRAAWDAQPDLNFVIEEQEMPDISVRREGKRITVLLSPSFVELGRSALTENIRKAGVLLRLTHDFRSITQSQVTERQRQVRKSLAKVLGNLPAARPAQFLLRVDDFPSPAAGSAGFLEFHEIARAFGIPYLLAVTPFLKRENKSEIQPAEAEILRRCAEECVDFALHGFTHERRFKTRASELAGMPVNELREKLSFAERNFQKNKIQAIAFVAPFNSYDRETLPVLAEHFPILCGGPESVSSAGYLAPSYLHRSLYLPSYRNAYNIKETGLAEWDRLAARSAGLTVPVTLHWANEVKDGFKTFRLLCSRLKGRTLAWRDFLSQTDRIQSWGKTESHS